MADDTTGCLVVVLFYFTFVFVFVFVLIFFLIIQCRSMQYHPPIVTHTLLAQNSFALIDYFVANSVE